MLKDFTANRVCILKTAEETFNLGKAFAKQTLKPTIFFLKGDLGSGKTTFSKGFIQEMTDLDSSEITSPTFVYMNLYEREHLPIYHFDLYRLNSLDTFYSLGFEEILTSPCIALIEWPDLIERLNFNPITLQFSVYGDQRKVEWT
jgi:tRNA threonylcarbamoyladenosine biosynthesis protein TsaE